MRLSEFLEDGEFNNIGEMVGFAHKDVARLDNGLAVRQDAIIAELNSMFDGKNILGIGYNDKIVEKVIEPPNNKYVATQIVYKIADFNEKSVRRAKSY